jgi:hypothetical protein
MIIGLNGFHPDISRSCRDASPLPWVGQWRRELNSDYFVDLLLQQTAIGRELQICCIALNAAVSHFSRCWGSVSLILASILSLVAGAAPLHCPAWLPRRRSICRPGIGFSSDIERRRR